LYRYNEVVKLTAAESKAAAGPARGDPSEGWRSEATLEDRQADRKAWIAAWTASVK
jgi:hypothetical protein